MPAILPQVFHFRRATGRWYLRTMKIDSLEKGALRVLPEERARLAELLLSSLDEQVDSGTAQLIPSDEVEKKASSLLR
jgi:hypothetical protein